MNKKTMDLTSSQVQEIINSYISEKKRLWKVFISLLGEMSSSDRSQLVNQTTITSKHYFPGISIVPEVCGGDPCIQNTRIPVWLLVRMNQQGFSEEMILKNYPTISKEDLLNAWAYYLLYTNEIERQIIEHEEA